MTSNVGGSGVYEAGDQRNVKASEVNDAERYKEGQPNSHKANDSSTPLDASHILVNRADEFAPSQRTSDPSQTNSQEKAR